MAKYTTSVNELVYIDRIDSSIFNHAKLPLSYLTLHIDKEFIFDKFYNKYYYDEICFPDAEVWVNLLKSRIVWSLEKLVFRIDQVQAHSLADFASSYTEKESVDTSQNLVGKTTNEGETNSTGSGTVKTTNDENRTGVDTSTVDVTNSRSSTSNTKDDINNEIRKWSKGNISDSDILTSKFMDGLEKTVNTNERNLLDTVKESSKTTDNDNTRLDIKGSADTETSDSLKNTSTGVSDITNDITGKSTRTKEGGSTDLFKDITNYNTLIQNYVGEFVESFRDLFLQVY